METTAEDGFQVFFMVKVLVVWLIVFLTFAVMGSCEFALVLMFYKTD